MHLFDGEIEGSFHEVGGRGWLETRSESQEVTFPLFLGLQSSPIAPLQTHEMTMIFFRMHRRHILYKCITKKLVKEKNCNIYDYYDVIEFLLRMRRSNLWLVPRRFYFETFTQGYYSSTVRIAIDINNTKYLSIVGWRVDDVRGAGAREGSSA